MAQTNSHPGIPAGWPTYLPAVSPNASEATHATKGLSTVSAQTNPQNPGVMQAPQGANQNHTSFVNLPTSTLKATAPGVPNVTQAS